MEDDNLKDMINKMLDYGAYAQKYFLYDTENSAVANPSDLSNVTIPDTYTTTLTESVTDKINVVVFAYFSDDSEGKAFFENQTNRDKIKKYYDGTHGRSFTKYMETISEGNFKVHNILPQDNGTIIQPYCIKSTTLQAATTSNQDETIITELIKNLPAITDSVVDYNNDGLIDNFTIVLHGGKNAVSGSSGTSSLYSHMATYASDTKWSGKYVVSYNMLDTYGMIESTLAQEAGVISHEFLHTLGYPDLYTDTNGKDPVHTWDIMASVSHKQSYPLAYMRKYISGWLTDDEVPTITESTTNLKLDLQSAKGGKKAYILKSPFDDKQFFVIEFRQKPAASYTNEDTLDYFIGGTGLIVYRIDTRIEHLSNHFGDKYGVYVMRPQKGQNGYSDNSMGCVANAYLSKESGRTSRLIL